MRSIDLECRIPAPGSPQFVITGVDCDPSQPTWKVLIRPDLINPRKDFKKNILREVFNILPMPEKSGNQTKNHRRKLPNQFLLSGPFPGLGTNNQFGFKSHK